MNPKIHLSIEDRIPLENSTPYRELIGRLLYLTITRPDVTYAVNRLSQFVSKPKDLHLQAAHKVLQYIKNDPGQGLLFTTTPDLTLAAFCGCRFG